jgi:large subunit ribosomal protein L18
MRTEKKQKLKQLRRWRIRKKVTGTKDRPRMSVCFTNENIHVQFIDDDAGVTLAAASTVSKTARPRKDLSANVKRREENRRHRGEKRPGQGHQGSGV